MDPPPLPQFFLPESLIFGKESGASLAPQPHTPQLDPIARHISVESNLMAGNNDERYGGHEGKSY
ncbi:unnamed protein product [Prunus armeniaca]|uniref:Uncharacterized protein n=1 Tax=Prunus armeniaca TaxID=36596 RepID=A0A6J5W1F1_PRUAR|nr:unnamed protein product [Prunus armeniaca]